MVYTIGESVLDIIIKDFDDVKIRPGGSMLNTAISLGRLGVEVSHISYLSKDISSEKLLDFLHKNRVDTSFISQKAEKTNLALAYLDTNNNASYTFYKEKKDVEISFNFPKIKKGDYILFGSFFCLNSDYRDSIVQFLGIAKSKGAIIMYDPNYRKAHLSELQNVKQYIIENLEFADIVKASDEDLLNLFEIKTGKEAYRFLQQYKIKTLLYTRGEKSSQAFVNDQEFEALASEVHTISTIGAGDTFSAGVLYSLVNQNESIDNFKHCKMIKWVDILKLANLFAGQVCASYDNYLNESFIQNLKNVQ